MGIAERWRLWLVPVLVVAHVFRASQGADFPAPLTEAEKFASHQWMVEALAEIEADTAGTNPFLGRFLLEQARRELASLPPDAALGARFDALVRLGIEETNHGFEREAIAHLEQAIDMLEGRNLPEPVWRAALEAGRYLAVACLRLAETENCCALPGPHSCTIPFRGGAIHQHPEGSEKAIQHLLWLLGTGALDSTSEYELAWLLNLANMTLGRAPGDLPTKWRLELPAEIQPSPRTNPVATPDRFPEFLNIAAEAGVDTFSLSGGAVADDFDGDGWLDLVVSSWDPSVETSFFRNRGDGTFERKEANLDGIKGGLNLVQADYDNDGDLDIFVTRGAWLREAGHHPNSLLENDGTGRFTDVSHAVGLALPAYPTQTACWEDYDLDGDLDLFVGNESVDDHDAPCRLFRNDGGRFIDVAEEAGVAFHAYVKGAGWGDYDGDGWPDLVLSDLTGSNRLARNRGDGSFEDVSALLRPDAGPKRSFPTWFFDYDNDGWLDLFLSGYSSTAAEVYGYYRTGRMPAYSHPCLYRNLGGDKGFLDSAVSARLDRPMLPMGCNFGDLTGNGYPDMYLGTGTPSFELIVPNTLYINDSGTFFDLTLTSRMGHLQKGHAIAFADFDRDGDLDVFAQMGGALPADKYYDALYQNPGFGRHWLGVKLVGTRSNRFGVGCRVRVLIDEPGRGQRWIHQWMSSGGSFGANPLELHFGLGEADKAERLEVFWPVSGKTQVIENPAIDRLLTIREES